MMESLHILLLLLSVFFGYLSSFQHTGKLSVTRINSQFELTMVDKHSVLIIGGTRFSGLYLWRELHKRGHEITLFNRGKTAFKRLPDESTEEFENRVASTKVINGDRREFEDLKSKLSGESFDVIYDMNGREASDTAPLVEIFNGKVKHFVYMSSAGVYKKSFTMPHFEADAEDLKSRHKGKLETEALLRESGIPFTAIRPTYIYGPMNYNPLEEYFFTRLDEGRAVCIPGHGQHITGLGHVADLAVAMAQVIGRDACKGQVYNIQDVQSVSFEGLARLCAESMGQNPAATTVKLYEKSQFDFGEKKAFPMREQHFFCSVEKAMRDLDWAPQYSMLKGLKDSYENDFKIKKAAGKLKVDFTCDDMVLKDDRIAVRLYDGMPKDSNR